MDGTCAPCPAYTTLSNDGKTCRAARCDENKDILQADGSCKPCPDYEKPTRMAGSQPADKIHYLLVLDRSGSMGGDQAGTEWTNLVEAVEMFLDELANTPAIRDMVRISAVAYSDKSAKVFHELEPSGDLIDRIDFTGGGTDFELPMAHVLEYIQNAKGSY